MKRIAIASAAAALIFTSFAFLPATGEPAAADQKGAKAVFEDGQAQVVEAFKKKGDWIRHYLWVETEFDSDGDGKLDRMHVDVTRPEQTETEGFSCRSRLSTPRLPSTVESFPYAGGHLFIDRHCRRVRRASPSDRSARTPT